MTITDILEQAQALSPQERKELAKLLIDSLDVPEAESLHDILEFEGIAAHLADDEDPQAYINRMRAEWDDRP
jgi:hypothetical protein